jgi:hypothetical protein
MYHSPYIQERPPYGGQGWRDYIELQETRKAQQTARTLLALCGCAFLLAALL